MADRPEARPVTDPPNADQPIAASHESADDSADQQLLRAAAAGDAAAFNGLLDRHADRLFRLAVSLVGNRADAEDVVQETFVGVYAGLKRFQGRASVRTWLTRILLTQAALHRRRKRTGPWPVAELANESSVAGEVGVAMDMRAALARLSPEHREVLVLREFEGMDYAAMAEALGLPRGTVESRLHRARAALRERLAAYETDR